MLIHAAAPLWASKPSAPATPTPLPLRAAHVAHNKATGDNVRRAGKACRCLCALQAESQPPVLRFLLLLAQWHTSCAQSACVFNALQVGPLLVKKE